VVSNEYLWSPEDVENAAHLFNALKAEREAWAVCRKTGMSGPPWYPARMPYQARQEFANRMEKANQEAKRVRRSVLQQMHVELPSAFDDFITYTSDVAYHARTQRHEPRAQTAFNHWRQWWEMNHWNVHVPRGAR
jgi:hypothetical protein